jgi:hypothetical protein
MKFTLIFDLPHGRSVVAATEHGDTDPIRFLEGSPEDLDRNDLDTLDAWATDPARFALG